MKAASRSGELIPYIGMTAFRKRQILLPFSTPIRSA